MEGPGNELIQTNMEIEAPDETRYSPFFKLPAELRSLIYDMTVVRAEYSDPELREIPAITQVCRQLRFETQPLFLRHSHFEIWSDLRIGRASRVLKTWIYRVIGEAQIHHIRHLTFTLDVPWWSVESWKVHLNFEYWPLVRAKVEIYSPDHCGFRQKILKKVANMNNTVVVEQPERDVVVVDTMDVFSLVRLVQDKASKRFVTFRRAENEWFGIQ